MRKRFKRAQRAIEAMESRLLFSIIYVDANAPGTTHDGKSWATAFTDLQQAIVLTTTTHTDQVLIADGTYRPTPSSDRTATFYMQGNNVFGGYAGASDPNAPRDVQRYQTILSGDIGIAGNNADNSYHVVTILGGSGDPTTLDGVTVTAGNANGGSSTSGGGIAVSNIDAVIRNCNIANNSASSGGGISDYDSSPTITNCSFVGNSATINGFGGGGGMYNIADSSPTLINCTFSGNSAASEGGAIHNDACSPILTNCTFSGNSAAWGGVFFNYSTSSPTLTGCSFQSNTATYYGGAMDNETLSTPSLISCFFIRNSAADGGALFNSDSNPAFQNCEFFGNSSPFGGAVYDYARAQARFTDCLFSGNSASNGGVEYDNQAYSTFIGSDLVDNSASVTGGAIYNRSFSTTLTNCVVWGNTAPSSPEIYVAPTENVGPTVGYTDIQGNWTGTGNIDADPQFIRSPSPGADNIWGTPDDDYGDLRLRATSPCVDTGNNSAVASGVTTDLAGNPRIIDTPTVHDPGAIVDMGAYEYQSPLTASGGTYLHSASRPTVQIAFNGDVNSATIDPNDLVLYNQTTGQTIDTQHLATVSYDSNSRSATWTFNTSLLPDGNYHATLAAGSCSDTLGNPLGGTYEFDFFVLAGDANHDGVVNVADLSIVAQNWQGNGKVFSQGDFNYDGKVDQTDLQILAANWNKTPGGAALGPLIPMPNLIPLSPPPPPPVVMTTTALKRTKPSLVTQVL